MNTISPIPNSVSHLLPEFAAEAVCRIMENTSLHGTKRGITFRDCAKGEIVVCQPDLSNFFIRGRGNPDLIIELMGLSTRAELYDCLGEYDFAELDECFPQDVLKKIRVAPVAEEVFRRVNTVVTTPGHQGEFATSWEILEAFATVCTGDPLIQSSLITPERIRAAVAKLKHK